MEKYGFVYIWYDRKHKRYYVGCHWGREDDGYICSSSWMKQAYKHRPNDFKRKILKAGMKTKSELLEEEHKWLSMIRESELGTRYYNLTNHHNGHWSTADNALSVREKLSKAWTPERRHRQSFLMKNRIVSEETKEKLCNRPKECLGKNKGKRFSEEVRLRMKESKQIISVETRNRMSLAKIGRSISEKTKERMKIAAINRDIETEKERRKKISTTMKNNKFSSQPIILDEVVYPSISEAMRHTKRSKDWVMKRAVRL